MEFKFSFHAHQNSSSSNLTNVETDQISDDDEMFNDDCCQHVSSPYATVFSPFHSPTSNSLLYHCIASLHRHKGSIYSVAVSKQTLFTSSKSKRIHVWRQPDCLESGFIKASSGQVRVILSYDNMLFTSHMDNKIRVWNWNLTSNSENFRYKKVSTLPPKRHFLSTLRLSNPNITHLGVSQQQHKDCISCMAYYHREGILYTGSRDKTVKAWRVSDKKCVDSFVAHQNNVNCIIVNQDDGCVFTSSSDGSVKIWRKLYKENSHTLTMILKLIKESPVHALALSSSFKNYCFLYSGSSDGNINFWEKEKMSSRYNHVGVLHGHRFGVLCLAVVGNLILSGSEDCTIRVWKRDMEGSYFHDCVAVLEGHIGPVRCLVACLDMENHVMGCLVYSASLDHTLKVWKIRVMNDFENDDNEYMNNHQIGFDSYGSSSSSKNVSNPEIKKMDYEISPVLSPSWVETKLRG